MTYLGPWIQGPDFEAGFTYGHNGHVADGVLDVHFTEVEIIKPSEPFIKDDITGIADAARDVPPSLEDMVSQANSYAEWGYIPIPGTGTLNHWRRGYYDPGYRVVRPGVQPGNPVLDDLPDNAIGVEWEGEHTLLTAVLGPNTALYGDMFGGDGPQSFETRLCAAQAGLLTYNDDDQIDGVIPHEVVLFALSQELALIPSTEIENGAANRTLDTEIDLLPWVDDDGRVTLFTLTNSGMTPNPATIGVANISHEYAHGFLLWELSIVRTFRPARHRFIFEGDPYRRITNRKDGLAGGARRVGGTTKTIQGSNRRGSGAIV